MSQDQVTTEITANAEKPLKKVMLVEDDRELRRMMCLSLGCKVQAQVIVATDGLMAVMMARQEKPDLILMDLNMPCVDGFKAIGLLQSDRSTRHIPIIAFSNHSWDFDWMKKATDLGCARCYEKSKHITDLPDIVQHALDNQD
jgi:CheY-like chemotaxis protein